MQKQYKIVILGAPGVGKSSLTNRYINGLYNDNMTATLGAVFFEKVHQYGQNKNKSIKLQFWDTAGQQKFRSIAKIYYKDAKAAILVYDISDKQTFNSLKTWITELKQKGPQNITLAIVGNKTDLLDHQVSIIEAQNYASQNNALFKLISVKENKGIEELFDSLAVMLEKYGEFKEKGEKIGGDGGKGKQGKQGKQGKKKCC